MTHDLSVRHVSESCLHVTYVWHDSFTCFRVMSACRKHLHLVQSTMCLIRFYRFESYIWMIHLALSCVWHDLFTCVIWHDTWDMIHVSFICMTRSCASHIKYQLHETHMHETCLRVTSICLIRKCISDEVRTIRDTCQWDMSKSHIYMPHSYGSRVKLALNKTRVVTETCLRDRSLRHVYKSYLHVFFKVSHIKYELHKTHMNVTCLRIISACHTSMRHISYDSYHWKSYVPEIHQIEKLGFFQNLAVQIQIEILVVRAAADFSRRAPPEVPV